MAYYKQKYDSETFAKREILINMWAGLLGGSIGAAATNALEAITVAKQTNPSTKIGEMIKREGPGLLTKGLLPRVYYNGAQSIVFFNLVFFIGKYYDVELADD